MEFSGNLLSWFRENGRVLPWRGKKNAYYTWLSEIMLQQTRVEAVKGYFFRFIERFPDIKSLAFAEEEEVLKLWEGLGYYSRARNLHKGAKLLVEKFDGNMPKDYADILSIPGIGEYTAAAISSIVFGEKRPAVDGNLLRVFSRCECYEGDILSKEAKFATFQYFQEKMRDFPGDFNEALMDLGATVCLPKGKIECASCPISLFCKAHRAGNPEDYPKRQQKKPRTVEKYSIFVFREGDRIALVKRPKKGVLAGLYGFYQVEGHVSKREALQEAEKLGFSALKLRELGATKHIFTHKEWDMIGYEIDLGEFPEAVVKEEGFRFYTREEIKNNLSIPSAYGFYKSFVLS